MTYTIKYTDILAFKKDSRKDHTETINKIFQIVSNIKSNIKSNISHDNFIVITFDETVKFVDPLFFILLFDLRNEYKSTLVIDIRYMEEDRQHYIHRILTQYSDLEQFKSYSPYSNNEQYIPIDIIEKKDTAYREEEFKKLKKKTIHFFTKVKHKKSLINDSEYEYSLLPVLRLRNFDLKEIDSIVHEDALDPYDKRIKFYNELSLEQSPKEYRENLQNKIESLLTAVGLKSRGLSGSFRDIFFELIDNIRKHTPAQSNAHISFRKDISSKLYELIIADNSRKGFLNTYKQTLQKEQERLDASGIPEKFLKNYDDVIDDINHNEYKKVLKGLFEIQRTKPNTSDNEMHIHQIPRIAMHFGLPLLIKLLEKISPSNKKIKPELKIYLHNDDKYFEIKYSFNQKDGKYSLTVNDESPHNKKGSYIIITFPEDVKLSDATPNDNTNNTLKNLSFKNNDYKYFLAKKNAIQSQINKFEFYEDSHIRDDLDDEKINYKCETKCAVIRYTGSSTFSDFLRNLYLYAYKQDVEDIVVVNAPLYEYGEDWVKKNHENTEHLKLLRNILYGEEDKEPYEKSLNILFYSDRDLSAVLIGGRDQQEYIYLNQLLSGIDERLEENSIRKKEYSKPKGLLPSKLFIDFEGNGDTKSILPFELFDILDMKRRNSTVLSQEKGTFSILRDLIEKYLNEVAKRDNDIHIDTGSGYHIDRYMEFKKVFEDSRWVKRLAFRLAMHFPMHNETIKYYLYGTDKYTNMLISLCYTFLDLKDFKRFKYKLFNLYDGYDYPVLREKIKQTKDDGSFDIYLISSVIVGASTHIKLIEEYDIEAIPAIQLDVGRESYKKIKPLLTIKNHGKVEKITDDRYCKFCKGQRAVPLLELTKDDPFFIKDTFFEPQSEKSIVSYAQREDIHVKWFDSLNFGHVKRGDNHFLYYVNTVKFFNENRITIKDFLSEDVKNKINYDDEEKKEKIILLTSSHDTNNNFVALVNQEVFDNDAIILSFNKLRGEANFHDLKSYEYFNWENARVFFVDDSIASSHTLKYFYQLLRSVPNIMTRPNVGLDGVIVMIDRISSYDETILCSYLRDRKEIDKPNKEMQKEKLEALHVFSTFDIKPIKSEVEKCFLCTRRNRYSELAKKSALDLTTFQMARRAYKLKQIPYREVLPAKEKSLKDRFKIYLKAMATNYIYQHYVHQDSFEDFDVILEKFSTKIYDDIVADKERRFQKYEENVLRKIITFQSEIALLKALSFPKLSYYYSMRKKAIETILAKLKLEVTKVESKDFILTYPLEDAIGNLDKESSDEKDKHFLEFYKGMTNLHLINVYLATLGYFEDSKILDADYIRLYYKITQNKNIRDKKTKDKTLLHTYPFAVKFTIADNLEKANYFEKNLNKVFQDINYRGNERKKKYAHINALRIENTLYWENFIKTKIEKKTNIKIEEKMKELKKEKNIEDKIEMIKTLFSSVFNNLKVHLFVSPHVTTASNNYQEYLDKSTKELVNILDSFHTIGNYSDTMGQSVEKVFYGAIDRSKDNEDNIILEKVREKEIIEEIDNTWANEYTDDYIVIRLTSVSTKLLFSENKNIKNNKQVWFRPIGCIVIEKDNADYNFHIESTRTILSLKNHIVNYVEREFSHGLIQEAIQKVKVKIEAKKEIKDEYMNIISQIYHSAQDFIGINDQINTFLKADHTIDEYKDYLGFISKYTWGLKLLASLSKLQYKEDSEETTDINFILGKNIFGQDKDFTTNIKNFLYVSKEFTDDLSKDTNFTINLCKNCNCNIPLSEDLVKIIIFEMILNALKRMKDEVNPFISITIQNNSIIFKNKYTDEVEAKKHVQKINNITVENTERMGIATIKELLFKISYTLDAELDEDAEGIKITIKEK